MDKKKKALLEKYLKLLKKDCFTGDTERDHIEADSVLTDLLRELGFDELVKEYEKVSKWYA